MSGIISVTGPAKSQVDYLDQYTPIPTGKKVGDGQYDAIFCWMFPPVLAYLARSDTQVPFKEKILDSLFADSIFDHKVVIKTTSTLSECLGAFNPKVVLDESFLNKILLRNEDESWKDFRIRFRKAYGPSIEIIGSEDLPSWTEANILGLLGGYALLNFDQFGDGYIKEEYCIARTHYQAFQEEMKKHTEHYLPRIPEEDDDKGSEISEKTDIEIDSGSEASVTKAAKPKHFTDILLSISDMAGVKNNTEEDLLDVSQQLKNLSLGRENSPESGDMPPASPPETPEPAEEKDEILSLTDKMVDNPTSFEAMDAPRKSTGAIPKEKRESGLRQSPGMQVDVSRQDTKDQGSDAGYVPPINNSERALPIMANKRIQTIEWTTRCERCSTPTDIVLDLVCLMDAINARKKNGDSYFWSRVGEVKELAQDMIHAWSADELIQAIINRDPQSFDELAMVAWSRRTLNFIVHLGRLKASEIKRLVQVQEELTLEARMTRYFSGIDVDPHLSSKVSKMLDILERLDIKEMSKSSGPQAFSRAMIPEPIDNFATEMLANHDGTSEDDREEEAAGIAKPPVIGPPKSDLLVTEDGYQYKKSELVTAANGRQFIYRMSADDMPYVYWITD